MQLQSAEEMLTLIGGLIVAYFVYILISRKNDKPSTDPPAMAHAALKEIVERAVEEARKLPGLHASSNAEHPREERATANNSYEDLLATAILNKVIEKYQRERVDGNSNVLHDTDPPKAKYNTAIDNEYDLEEDAASYTSDYLVCNGDHNESIRRNEDLRKPMSFTMEERIEEVTTITLDDDEHRNGALEFGCTRRVPFPEYGMDIIDPPRELPSPSLSSSSDSSYLNCNEYPSIRTKRHAVDCTMDIISPIESWEDNWLFQKKRTSRLQPDAVAMLVPSSNAYYKALIGDRDAEDTSDLSECSSTKSDEEIEKELMEAINNVIPRTPRISECDATNSQTESNQEEIGTTQLLGKDEIDSCQIITQKETNMPVCERKELLKFSEISEKKTSERKDEIYNGNENIFALMTMTEEKDTNKETSKDLIENSKRTIVLESSVQKEDAKIQSEKSSEKSDRVENVNENEEQRESEYTEHYDTAIQRHLDSLTKVEVCSGENEADETKKFSEKLENNSVKESKSLPQSETKVQLSYITIDENHADIMNKDDPLSAPPRPGTIAEREHKKWENAPPIENNPYSEESIRKRCLERQYSRNSDIPGVHYELTKLNEANLETLLAPDRSDIKRFGRDYYINQSKAASGERQERDKSAMSSISSRPSSSLSQSSCTGDEHHERQVSHDKLKQFEAVLLRDSLPRQRCRDPRASTHFAVNPLLHLESDQSRHDNAGNLIGNDIQTTNDRASKNSAESNRSWNDGEWSVEDEEPIIPRYENRAALSGDGDDHDHDSGMCSIDSRDSESNDRWRQLYRVADDDHPGSNEQISIGGKKFWTTGGYKYHTFGGIKIRPESETKEFDDEFEDESISLDPTEDRSAEFARLKFQTFGGIKRSKKINSRRIQKNCRRILFKPILPEATSVDRNFIETKESANLELHSNVRNVGNCDRSINHFTNFEYSTNSNFEESDWEDEINDVINNQASARYTQIKKRKNKTDPFRTDFTTKQKNSIRKKNSMSLWSLSNDNDEWQDEIDYIPDEIIMNKFLKDVSRRGKAFTFNKGNIPVRGETKSERHRGILEDKFENVNSEKLEKPITRNVERNRDCLKKFRQAGRDTDKERYKKLYVRSLSDVTIW